MAKVTQSKFSPEKRERLAEIVKLKAKREKRMLKLQTAIKKGGGAALRGLGRAFMKGGKV